MTRLSMSAAAFEELVDVDAADGGGKKADGGEDGRAANAIGLRAFYSSLAINAGCRLWGRWWRGCCPFVSLAQMLAQVAKENELRGGFGGFAGFTDDIDDGF